MIDTEYLEQFRPLRTCLVTCGESRGFGFVEMPNSEEAEKALAYGRDLFFVSCCQIERALLSFGPNHQCQEEGS